MGRMQVLWSCRSDRRVPVGERLNHRVGAGLWAEFTMKDCRDSFPIVVCTHLLHTHSWSWRHADHGCHWHLHAEHQHSMGASPARSAPPTHNHPPTSSRRTPRPTTEDRAWHCSIRHVLLRAARRSTREKPIFRGSDDLSNFLHI